MLKSKIGLKLSITISIAFIVLVLFLTIIANKSSAATLTVDDDGNAKYMKIQDAIDAAGEGDTVRVYEGLYVENVVVGKTVSLVGNGSEVTTIDGGGSGDVVRITADWVNISGLSITGSGSNWLDSGIKVESDNNIISHNNCSNNHYGIYLYSSSYCTITNITMIENGIYIVGSLVKNWDSHTIDTTNTVNGKPVYYYKNISGFTVPYGTGQVILANCTWTYVENQNCSNGSVGILVGYSSNITFENNTCNSNNDDGIYLWDSSNCTIENNTCENNNGGIALYDSSGCTITNNTCENNYGGIYLRDSSNCTIENNTCENNNFGIWLDSSSDCTLENNTCENNRCGIYLDSSSDCTLESNTCENNNGNGIRLYRSSDCTIENNTISENRVGIYKSSSSQHTTAHYNNIYNNTEYGIAAFYDTINATNNWWGAASGPYHPTENPEGEGDNITDYVLFDPWLVEEVNWPPEAHIDSISPDPAVEGERILLVGHGTDDGSIIGYAWRSSLDGEFYNGTDSEIKYDELSNGTHTIYFKVQDNHGIWSDEVSDTLTVNGKPRAHIDSISPEAAVVWQTVSFKGCGTDDGSIERYIWRTDEKDLYNGTNSSFTLSTLSVGNHTIYLKVQDNYGIWSDEVNTTLTINAPPNKIPTITIASPKDGDKVSGTVTIKGTASDEDGTVEKVEVSINSGGWTKVTGTTGWSYEWDTTKIKNGEYEIKLRAFDGEDYSDEVVWKLTVENKKDDDKGFIPGFAFMALVIGLAVAVYLKKVK
ncbi:MAG: right-handed parallel beta-helix repeat-containing protein [Thermoplasmata archaeon]|nr:right-handed parallel beta-helix repeat-containing protein [Thermoplasmata archaeon]